MHHVMKVSLTISLKITNVSHVLFNWVIEMIVFSLEKEVHIYNQGGIIFWLCGNLMDLMDILPEIVLAFSY
jgi:hypothetical protein